MPIPMADHGDAACACRKIDMKIENSSRSRRSDIGRYALPSLGFHVSTSILFELSQES
jgi:hypothetical protein